jgi:hypothetical protein
MENQIATLSVPKKIYKVDSIGDYTYYKIGLFTFYSFFVLAISTLVVEFSSN